MCNSLLCKNNFRLSTLKLFYQLKKSMISLGFENRVLYFHWYKRFVAHKNSVLSFIILLTFLCIIDLYDEVSTCSEDEAAGEIVPHLCEKHLEAFGRFSYHSSSFDITSLLYIRRIILLFRSALITNLSLI